MTRTLIAAGLCGLLILPSAGCVERVLRITTEPPGARVYVNGEERGYTTKTRPTVEVPFLWYGNYEITVRKEGFVTETVTYTTRAPAYQWIGPDLIAETSPIHYRDVHNVPVITLTPREGPPIDDSERRRRREALLDRAEELQQRVK
jgi:hypothetical protein